MNPATVTPNVITVEAPLYLPEVPKTNPESNLDNVWGADTIKKANEYLQAIRASELLPGFMVWTVENGVRVKPSTGFPTLDNELNGGLPPGLIIIGAISSLGKTTFALQIADQIARSGEPVVIISLEMSRYELIAKSISRESAFEALDRTGQPGGLSTYQVMNTNPGGGNDPALIQLHSAANRYQKQIAPNLYITYHVETIQAIESTIEAIKYNHKKPPVVILDYLQILPPENPKLTDKQNTDIAVREMKRMSVKYDIPFIAISSVNRDNYKHQMTMAAFKESGSIEYSSDILLGLQLKGAGKDGFDIDTEKRKNPRDIELLILKNRNGRTGGVIPLRFYPKYNLFLDGVEDDDIPIM